MFFTYVQNNSGGVFHHDDKLTQYVVVEADNADAANRVAESLGVYFDGCSQGLDCGCCGDRWHRPWNDDEGTTRPKLYDTNPKNFKPFFSTKGDVFCRVFYKDGTVREYRTK